MRLPLLYLCLLLAACTKEPGPVRLDFIGTSRFTSSNKTVAAGDTLSTRLYAESRNADLQRVLVTVTHEPKRNPYPYPVPLGAFRVGDIGTDAPLVYLDSVLTSSALQEFVFQTSFGVRTTSGTERWEFTAYDKDGNTSRRTFRLTVRKSDSLQVYHEYPLRVPARGTASQPPRRFVALRPGLALPAYTVRQNPEAQQLVDVVYQPADSSLAAPAYLGFDKQLKNWATRNHTELRRTALTPTDFTNAKTATLIQQGFDAGQPGTTDFSGSLTKDQVLAFKTHDGYYGLLRVVRIRVSPIPSLEATVRVTKDK